MSRAFFADGFWLHSKWVCLKVSCLVTLTNEPYIHWGAGEEKNLERKGGHSLFSKTALLKGCQVFGNWGELNVLFCIRHYYSLAGICCCFDTEVGLFLISTLLIALGIFVHKAMAYFLDKLCTLISLNKIIISLQYADIFFWYELRFEQNLRVWQSPSDVDRFF